MTGKRNLNMPWKRSSGWLWVEILSFSILVCLQGTAGHATSMSFCFHVLGWIQAWAMLQGHVQGRAPTGHKCSASLFVLLLPSRAGFRCLNLVLEKCLEVTKRFAKEIYSRFLVVMAVSTGPKQLLTKVKCSSCSQSNENWDASRYLPRTNSEW